jgi:azurin
MLTVTAPIHISVTVEESSATIDKSQVKETEEYVFYKTKEGKTRWF